MQFRTTIDALKMNMNFITEINLSERLKIDESSTCILLSRSIKNPSLSKNLYKSYSHLL